jgi:hypothetical protein
MMHWTDIVGFPLDIYTHPTDVVFLIIYPEKNNDLRRPIRIGRLSDKAHCLDGDFAVIQQTASNRQGGRAQRAHAT